MNSNRLIEGLGWMSVAAIVGGYAATTFDLLETDSVMYLCLNLFGAVGIIISSLDNKNYQPIVLNVVWAVIAGVGLMRVFI